MRDLILSRATIVWFLLVAATVASWEFGHGIGLSGRDAGIAIIVVAILKVRFVILEFMEVRHAPVWMRMIGEGWSALICAVLVVLFLQGSPAGG